MKSLRQLFVGVISAFGSSVLVLAAILLSLTEGGTMAAPVQPTLADSTAIFLRTEDLSITVTATRLLIITATNVPQLSCPIPPGWVPYTLEAGDTLDALAARTSTSADQIRQANCLLSSSLLPGTILYLPVAVSSPTAPTPSPQATATLQPQEPVCAPPRGWVTYRIQSKDTLTRLSRAYGVSVNQLMAANCLNSSLIVTGTILYVPNVPTRTPEQSATPTPTDTEVVEPSSTFTPESDTLTPTLTETPTETATETPTETPSETPSETPTETSTDLPAATIVSSETPSPAAVTPETNQDLLTPGPTTP